MKWTRVETHWQELASRNAASQSQTRPNENAECRTDNQAGASEAEAMDAAEATETAEATDAPEPKGTAEPGARGLDAQLATDEPGSGKGSV